MMASYSCPADPDLMVLGVFHALQGDVKGTGAQCAGRWKQSSLAVFQFCILSMIFVSQFIIDLRGKNNFVNISNTF